MIYGGPVSKWLNSDCILYGVDSLKLGGLPEVLTRTLL